MSSDVVVAHPLFLEDEGKIFGCSFLSQSIYSILCNLSYNKICFEEYSDMITVNAISEFFPSESISNIRKSLYELHDLNLIYFLDGMLIEVSNGKGDYELGDWQEILDERIKNGKVLPSDIICKQKARMIWQYLLDIGGMENLDVLLDLVYIDPFFDINTIIKRFVECCDQKNDDDITFEELLLSFDFDCRPLFFSSYYSKILKSLIATDKYGKIEFFDKGCIQNSFERENKFGEDMIYVIRAFSYNPIVKIGYSKDPNNRKIQLSCSCPYDVDLFYTTRGNKDLEQEIFQYIESERMHGEWFNIYPSAAVSLIEELKLGKI